MSGLTLQRSCFILYSTMPHASTQTGTADTYDKCEALLYYRLWFQGRKWCHETTWSMYNVSFPSAIISQLFTKLYSSSWNVQVIQSSDSYRIWWLHLGFRQTKQTWNQAATAKPSLDNPRCYGNPWHVIYV